MAIPPFFVISLATYPIRLTLIDLCSFENPSSLDKWVLTISPSSKDTGLLPSWRSFTNNPLAKVDLPEPDKPVKNTVNPLFEAGGWDFWSSFATSL